MMYLGIDPGTSCGWALLDASGQRVGSGAWDLRPHRHEGGGMRYLRARRYLLEVLATAGQPVAVVQCAESGGSTVTSDRQSMMPENRRSRGAV
jgi:hypothetical protein